MKNRKGSVLLCAFLFAAALIIESAVCSSPCFAQEKSISTLAEEVSSSNLLDTLTFLTSFGSRFSHDAQEQVIDYIAGELENAGAAIRMHEYKFFGQTWRNLVATVPGNASLAPGAPHLVVGAHVDSVLGCPGADDNASGAAAVMEAARVLAGAGLPMRVDFVFFTLEEHGAIGSGFYAQDAKASGEVITAMIAVDMVGFESSPGDLDLVTKPSMAWLAEDYQRGSDAYTDLDTVLFIDEACG